MKKTIKFISVIAIVILLAVALTGCTTTETSTNIISTETENGQSAEEIINKMKEKNTNIGKVVDYNSETDLNKLLGRPKQYTSKITFEDKRLKQVNLELDKEKFSEAERNEPTGGTIEVFDNETDMKNRKEYIENFISSPMFLQYLYSKGNALLRLEGKLTPEQAKEYETIFNEIV